MKFLASLFSLYTCCMSATLGGTFTNGSPAGLSGMKIVWAVPTNVWPVDKIWSYKVVPQKFSEAAISNAMTLGSFSTNDRVKLSADAFAVDRKALCFENKAETKWLVVLPTLGYLKFYDQDAVAKAVSAVKDVPEPVSGVPDLAEATRLGLKYARFLGIDVSLFARKPHSRDFDLHWVVTTRGWTDQKTKKENSEIQGFGIDFTRSIDGIELSGYGDLYVDFGNNAKIHELELSWRNLQRYELLHSFVTSEQIVKSIQNGQTALPHLADFPVEQIQTLTITNATPRYGRKPGDEPMDFVVPALQLDAIADNGKTNNYFWFQTGIFPLKKEGGSP